MKNTNKSEALAALEQENARLKKEIERLRDRVESLKDRLDVWEDEDLVPEKPEIPDPVSPVSPVNDFAKAIAVNPGSDTTMLVWFAKQGRPHTFDQEEYNEGMSPFQAARDYYLGAWDDMMEEDLCNLGEFSILVHDPESHCVFEYEAYIGFGKKPYMVNVPKVVGRHGLCPN